MKVEQRMYYGMCHDGRQSDERQRIVEGWQGYTETAYWYGAEQKYL